MNDAPIAGERLIFNWHNFLSGCSAWNLEDWQQWITQAERLRFNTIMVHAYGNNPMFSFSLNGETKPTGSLTNTRTGRDWGTENVLDVRKIVGGEGLFSGPVFGADASMVDGQRQSGSGHGFDAERISICRRAGHGDHVCAGYRFGSRPIRRM